MLPQLALWSPAGRPGPPYGGWRVAQSCRGWASGNTWPSMIKCRPGRHIFSPWPVWRREGKIGNVEYHQHNSDRKSHVMQLLSQEIVGRVKTADAPVQSPVGLLWVGDVVQRQVLPSHLEGVYLLDRMQTKRGQSHLSHGGNQELEVDGVKCCRQIKEDQDRGEGWGSCSGSGSLRWMPRSEAGLVRVKQLFELNKNTTFWVEYSSTLQQTKGFHSGCVYEYYTPH